MDMAVKATPATDIAKARRLKAARQFAKFSSAMGAAKAIGVTPPTYGGHENGWRRFSDHDAGVYAKAFGVRVEWLVFGTGDMIVNPDYRVETAGDDVTDKLALTSAKAETAKGVNLTETLDHHLNQLKSQPVATETDEKATTSHVHACDPREDDWLTQHELHMQTVADNSGSMIEDAIELHAALVEEDDKLYTADGKPLADKATLDASWRREIKAFRVLARMQCRTSEESQMKLAYFLRPTEPDEYSNMERLTLDAYVDEAKKGNGSYDLEEAFLHSLLVKRQ